MKVNVAEKLDLITRHWETRVVAELNGQHVRLAKLLGTFVWHAHDHEDELFFVVSGRLKIEFRDRDVWPDPGEMLVVPRGVDHRPVAAEEVAVLLFEPAETVNTGSADDDRTVADPEWV